MNPVAFLLYGFAFIALAHDAHVTALILVFLAVLASAD